MFRAFVPVAGLVLGLLPSEARRAANEASLSEEALLMGMEHENLTALTSTSEPAPLIRFYMYRAISSRWPQQSSMFAHSFNFANAAGVMKYIHSEVIGEVLGEGQHDHCRRKWNIDKIYRYEVLMKSSERAMAFDRSGFLGFVAMDQGQCTVPNCTETWWEKYGYVPGCQTQDESFTRYPNALWYSFPGRCPWKSWTDMPTCPLYTSDTGACQTEPDKPDGERCTFDYKPAGQVDLDELVGIKGMGFDNYKAFCEAGNLEFNTKDDDTGVTLDFWKDYHNKTANKHRTEALKGKLWDVDRADPVCGGQRPQPQELVVH